MIGYEEALRNAGLDVFFEKLGWSFEELMLAPADKAVDCYEGYRWMLLDNRAPIIAHGKVAFAIPPVEKADVLPWEEWFIMNGKAYHQVFYLYAHPKCNAQWTAPDEDDQHPEQILGQTWNYYVDEDLRPALLQG